MNWIKLGLVLGILMAGMNAFAADGDLIVNGNIGVGTASPAVRLHVFRSEGAGTDIRAEHTGNWVSFTLKAGSGTPSYIWQGLNESNLRFDTSGSGRMIIDNNGAVGIGTTSPQYLLDVNGAARNVSGTWVVSDGNTKKNITPLVGSLAKAISLRGVTYEWNREAYPDKNFGTGTQIGFVAQEVEAVYPELVKTDSEGLKSISYEKFTVILLEALKEQQQQIEALKSEVAALKARP